MEQGATAVKMNGSGRLSMIPTSAEVDAAVERLAAVRAVIGAERDVAIDFHGRTSAAAAKRILPELAPLRPMFVEEPLVPEQAELLPGVVACSPVPIATGERLYSRAEFLSPLRAGVAVLQPDLSHAGGISEVRRIGALAETHGAVLAPHCPLGPVALAASLQIALATPNFLIQEHSIGIHYNEGADLLDYVVDPTPLAIVDGHIAALGGPGLGITVDEAAVRAADRRGHAWRNPVWRHPDGGFAEW
jgi:galactonate dehydratase